MVGETEESELSEVSEELPELDGEELWELEMLEELLGRLEEVPDEELEDLSLLKQAVMLIIIAMASRTAVVRVSFIRLTPIKNNYTGQSLRRAHTEKRRKYFYYILPRFCAETKTPKAAFCPNVIMYSFGSPM
jgi:hypothetical protein